MIAQWTNKQKEFYSAISSPTGGTCSTFLLKMKQKEKVYMEKLTNKELENLLNEYCFDWEYIHLERYNKNIISIKLKENLGINLYLEKFKFGSSYITDDDFTLRDVKDIIRQYVLADAYEIEREELNSGSVTWIVFGGILIDLELVEMERLNVDYRKVLTDEQKKDILKYRNEIIENVNYLTKDQKQFIKYKI